MKTYKTTNAGATGSTSRSGSPLHGAQRGVVLLFSLITLVVLLIAAVALVRSFSNSLFTAGNIAFKRDLQNQSDRLVPMVLTLFNTGALSSPTARGTSLQSSNYSATILPTNSVGVPTALLNDAAFAAIATAPDVAVNALDGTSQQISLRYVIDRLCDNTGTDAVLGAGRCVMADLGAPPGKNNGDAYIPPPQQVIYRLSVRVTGPRNTQAFFQTTFGM